MKGYVSHESFWTDLRMFFNMIKISLILSVILQLIYFLLGFYNIHTTLLNTYIFADIKVPLTAIIKYYNYYPSGKVPVEDELQFLFGVDRIPVEIYKNVLNRRTNRGFDKYGNAIKNHWKKSLKIYYFPVLYIFIFLLKSQFESKDKHVRGIDVLTIKKLNKRLKRGARKDKIPNLKIGKSIIPRKMEPAHMLLMGAAGSGKSVLLNQLFNQINNRKSEENLERVVIYDMKGEFIEKHYTEDDYIFSPFDERTVKWSFFNEIKTLPDFDVISQSLYISPDPRNEYWYNCAKDVFRTGLIYLHLNEMTSNRDIWEFISFR